MNQTIMYRKQNTLSAINNFNKIEQNIEIGSIKRYDRLTKSDSNNRIINDLFDDLVTIKNSKIEEIEIQSLSQNNIRIIPNYCCLFCDSNLNEEELISSSNCNHFFCFKCGKLYFESKIEEGDNNLKCPIFKCECQLELIVLKTLISSSHLKNYLVIKCNKIENDSPSHIETDRNLTENRLIINNNHHTRGFLKRLNIFRKHVIHFDNFDRFKYELKAKEFICKFCYEHSLSGQTSRFFFKMSELQ